MVLKDILDPSTGLKTEGSTGTGRRSRAPWLRVFDRSASPSATDGLYVVYLFSISMDRVYLSLGQDVTAFRDQFGAGDRYRLELRKAASNYRSSLGLEEHGGADVDLAAPKGSLQEGYELGSIVAVEYNVSALPNVGALEADLTQMCELYLRGLRDPLVPNVDELLESAAVPPPEQVVEFLEPEGPSRQGRSGGRRGGSGSRRRPRDESKKIGDHGEELVIEAERARLRDGDRPDLAQAVDHPAGRGEYPGYDVSSFELDGSPRLIEVKASLSKRETHFVTRNEWEAAQRLGDRYWFYLVSNVFKARVGILPIQNPAGLVDVGELEIEVDRFVIRS